MTTQYRYAQSSASLLALLLGTVVVICQGAQAQEAASDTLEVSGSVEAGMEYNSNLSIQELESASGKSDNAAILEAEIDLSWQPGESWNIDSGYSYSGSRYQDIDAYDLDLHLLYIDISRDLGFFTLGGNYYFADATLDLEGFLTLHQYSVYIGKLFQNRYYLRGALNAADKKFDTITERDADNQGFSLDAFWFFDEGRSSLMLGYTFEDEDTRADAFDYRSDSIRLQYNKRFSLASKNTRLKLQYRWQDRNYSSITPVINEPRDDQQQIAEAELRISLLDNVSLIGNLQRGNYTSNLPSADYSETRFRLSAEIGF